MKKILLAGPGTGKTTKVKKDFLGEVKDFSKVLVLSFTNATINDLIKSFAKDGLPIDAKNCMTLHSYALRINHHGDLHVLNTYEERVVKNMARLLGVNFKLFCQMLDCITYDQMITDFIGFAKNNPVYLKDKVGEIELLIVDEFQDFNEIEQSLVHLIAEYAKDTLILGDDDQCIYDFKEATSDGIVALYNDSAIEKIGHENVCHRCADDIVEKSARLISNNQKRIAKDWHPSGIEGKVHFQQHRTMPETIAWAVEEMKRVRAENPKASILALAPVALAVETLPEALDNAAVPFVNFFGDNIDLPTYQLIWKLRLVYTKYKLLNLILTVCAADLSAYKKAKFRRVLKKHAGNGFTFANVFPDAQEFLDAEILSYVETQPDFETLLQSEPWSALWEMLSKIEESDAGKKLEKIDRYAKPPVSFNPEAVNIMSIHKSKGLEATHVFIFGLVDGILPRKTDGAENMETQRRLMFVGMTRAKNFLYLLSTIRWDAKHVHLLGKEKFVPVRAAGSRHYNAITSPFIAELNL